MTAPPHGEDREPATPEESGSRGDLVALVFIVGLARGGYWLFHELERHGEIQTCIASGHRDCAGDLLHPDTPPP